MSQTVCKFWAMSRCMNKRCPYLHPAQKSPPVISQEKAKAERVCKFWADGKCVKGERCPYLHAWFRGDGFQGHKKGITGIALTDNSSCLYSAAKDGTVRVWDCNTGQCSKVINLGAEAGCLISKGVWVFCGASNLVKAWNTECNTEFTLAGPVGQVHAMEVENDMVFAGTEEGVIYVWKGIVCSDTKANPFHPHQALSGHTGAVVSLRVGSIRLYTGSVDYTIRVWNLDTLECAMTLNGHSDTVTSLITWSTCLISCSLDHTIKAWSMSEGGKIEEIYTHTEEDGLLALSGMHDGEDQPLLFCSSKDNSVRMYDLPSFDERGKLFAKREVQAIQIGSGGLFFTGDETGGLSVWKWLEPADKQESSSA
ncbi:PREDICTED: zinc finger CCCH domain-containing protein 48-like [Fragaria vesca subsp. vesca]|uniref:zinc finger CCCH domain-containing protein 48-like n=1 Tax=Fragaria vesca subsp. vesca TaxID=101020 RepID=UPI0002C31824|nr:PREDICTED: zinc finger CCCH domain-containing protein 48-like [Fragaria vesca subsp. vesca]